MLATHGAQSPGGFITDSHPALVVAGAQSFACVIHRNDHRAQFWGAQACKLELSQQRKHGGRSNGASAGDGVEATDLRESAERTGGGGGGRSGRVRGVSARGTVSCGFVDGAAELDVPLDKLRSVDRSR